MTLSKERLEQYAYDVRMCNINDEIREMARELLERRERDKQEPVAWIVHARTGDQLTQDGGYVANAEGISGIHSTPLYDAPPGATISNSADIAIDELPQPFGNSEQLNSPVTPDGWAMVPVDPTWSMLSADGCSKHHDGQECSHHENRKRIWRAMLGAAPKQESE